MILRITEGNILKDSIPNVDIMGNSNDGEYAANLICGHITERISEIVNKITLQDLIDWQGEQGYIYSI